MEHSTLIAHQLDALETMDIVRIFSDYSDELVAIVNLDGKAKPLVHQSVKQVLLMLEPYAKDIKILLRKEAVDYGVLVLNIPVISRFVSFTVIAQEGKIAYLTIYAAPGSDCSAITVTADVVKKGKAATKVVWSHFFDMFSRKAEKIAPLYADEAVVITNLNDEPCIGHKAIYDFCDKLMNTFSSVKIRKMPRMNIRVKGAAGHLAFLSFEIKNYGICGTETYLIKNGRVQFESSLFNGDINAFLG